MRDRFGRYGFVPVPVEKARIAALRTGPQKAFRTKYLCIPSASARCGWDAFLCLICLVETAQWGLHSRVRKIAGMNDYSVRKSGIRVRKPSPFTPISPSREGVRGVCGGVATGVQWGRNPRMWPGVRNSTFVMSGVTVVLFGAPFRGRVRIFCFSSGVSSD